MDMIRFDPASGNMDCGDAHMHATRRETEIIVALVRRQGHVVTCGWLQDMLDPMGNMEAATVLKVYLSKLRHKLGEHHIPLRIETCWGRGYMVPADVPVEITADDTVVVDHEGQKLIRRLIETAHDTLLAERVRQTIFGD